jgi:hypothetical protein
MRVTEATTKRLFAVSGNVCAFPKCSIPLVDGESGKVTGRICHIRARNPAGPRYDSGQSDEDRNAFENLILLCPIHHDVIDADDVAYTVERLQAMKQAHEERWQNQASTLPPGLAGALVSLSNINVEQGSILVALNQAGAQIAQTITNINRVDSAKEAILEPVVRRVPQQHPPEYSTLEVRLRNVGNARPNNARVTLRFSESMHRHNTQDGLKQIRNGWVECERDTRFFEDQNAFDHLYPGDTLQQTVLAIHYYLEPAKALESTGEFEIQVRCGDNPPFLSRMTFGQFSALAPHTWYVLGPAGEQTYSEIVPAE